jgi:RimJ/RimL family protein N-acetyltransferase
MPVRADRHTMSAFFVLPEHLTAMPRLEGTRVRLRGLEERDLGALFALYSDPKVVRYGSHRAWHLESQAREYLERSQRGFADREFLQWGVALADGDRVVGTVTLFGFSKQHRRCELGYALAPGNWGRGYAREALSLALDFGFDVLHLYRVEADIDPRNVNSIHLVERLGFQREGLLRGRYHVGSEIQDSAFYGLLASDWRR